MAVDIVKCHTALGAALEWVTAGLEVGETGGDDLVLQYCEEVIAEIKRAAAEDRADAESAAEEAVAVPPLEE